MFLSECTERRLEPNKACAQGRTNRKFEYLILRVANPAERGDVLACDLVGPLPDLLHIPARHTRKFTCNTGDSTHRRIENSRPEEHSILQPLHLAGVSIGDGFSCCQRFVTPYVIIAPSIRPPPAKPSELQATQHVVAKN